MQDSSDIRAVLQDTRAFILYRLEPKIDQHGRPKLDKIPTSPIHAGNIDPHDPAEWMLPNDTMLWADVFNAQPLPYGVTGYGVGVVISDDLILPNGRKLFCLDIDKCRDGDRWAPHAQSFIDQLPGGGVEVSVSCNGLHVYGTYAGERPDHGTRNKTYGMELYTRLRFIACTGYGAYGNPLKDLTHELRRLAEGYFPPHDDADYDGALTDAPVPGWSGPEDDDELLRRALRSRSAGSVFGGRASFADLWGADPNVLARVFPPQQNGYYDASAVDQAICNHLAFWTGNHGGRILRLLYRSALVRDKWSRPGYLEGTIQRACGSQRQWYNDPKAASSPIDVTISSELQLVPATNQTAPIPHNPNAPIPPGTRPALGTLLLESDQVALFHGCVYVQDIHQVMMPQGHTLTSERFDAEFSGYSFATTYEGARPSRKAWDAFVFSEIHAFPKVKGMFFDPRIEPRTIITQEGSTFINSYVPSIIVRRQGDVSPFLTHLYKLLPLGNDAQILLSYFAACVQYAGYKFQWWPLIQGVEGNGKSTLSFLLEYAVGQRYTHWPKASELGSKFNSAFYGKMLICCEDVYISEARGSMWETLKPMITSPRIEIEGKGVDKVTRDVCFNGVMNSNHKNAIRKTANDRRVGTFFCPQQSVEDLERDGMTMDYMNRLLAWRLGEGREIVAHFLKQYEIPDKWNPAKECTRCPATTSTREAIRAGLGIAEQEIVEAVAQHTMGFRGGWISSTAIDRLLATIGKGSSIPRNKRREMLELLGYVPHPHLPEGRTTVNDTDGSRPYLYLLPTTAGFAEFNPVNIMAMYQQAQAG